MRIDANAPGFQPAGWRVIDAATGLLVKGVVSADDAAHEIFLYVTPLRVVGDEVVTETRRVPKVVIDFDRKTVLINMREADAGDAVQVVEAIGVPA